MNISVHTNLERHRSLAHTTSFCEVYHALLSTLMRGAPEETNARTGVKVRFIPGGTSFKLDLSNGRLPIPGNRAYFPHVAAAEAAWQTLGTQDPTFILKHAPKLWSKFVEDEVLKTAYGYRWTRHFGRDQIALAVEALRADPTNRQVWVQAWDPAADGLGQPNQPKNIPCPLGFSLTRSDNRLHISVFLRSSDVFVGLPYDVMGYALLLDMLSAELGVVPGTMHFTLAHAHIYEPHWEAAYVSITDGMHPDGGWARRHEPALPCWSWTSVKNNPEGYVQQVRTMASRVDRPKFNPMPEVIE